MPKGFSTERELHRAEDPRVSDGKRNFAVPARAIPRDRLALEIDERRSEVDEQVFHALLEAHAITAFGDDSKQAKAFAELLPRKGHLGA